ncbi:naringenin 3-dioxygenase [Moniliophthora roreri MCA 2997]|uniref:Naringenin 3-dioxygenase n=1 Tax=Moniliophthora roreri (strain MCA 2997) TaxID=1381753 RepID=V2WSS3_MONRO|nr:naringenin 3-dioxygenase [Moniliophthora roreri MCA 2997]
MTSIPILSFNSSQSPESKQQFLSDLRHALINTGFLYLRDTPVNPSPLLPYIPKLFALPQDEKDRISMRNSPHFLGYTRLGGERTKGKVDWREQIDLATPHVCRWKNKEESPDYHRVWGPSQYPSEEALPGFKEAIDNYQAQLTTLGNTLVTLIAEALGLGSDGLAKFYAGPEKMQHRGKIVCYPVNEDDEGQGVGPHYDAGFLTILLQASDHPGLQVQALTGEWLDAPPIPGTFVINFGRALEFATKGVVRATSHRVLSPSKEWAEKGPRYSVPLFHNIDMEKKWLMSCLQVPQEILDLRDKRGKLPDTDSVNYSEFLSEPSGRVQLYGRVKSHPDVGERWYPEIFGRFFPQGLPQDGRGNAY